MSRHLLKYFRYRLVHTAYPEKVSGKKTGNIVIVFAAPGSPRVVVTEAEYRAGLVTRER